MHCFPILMDKPEINGSPEICDKFATHSNRHDNAVSKIRRVMKSAPLLSLMLLSPTVTLSRSEGSIALGSEMLRCAQHDSAVTHTNAWIKVFMCILWSLRIIQANQLLQFCCNAVGVALPGSDILDQFLPLILGHFVS
jgi:hypothetical protein